MAWVVLAGLIAAGVGAAAAMPGRAGGGKWWLVAVPVLLGLAGAAAAMTFLVQTEMDWNSVRTAIPFALSHGIPIYYDHTGPLWCNIYPPLSFVLYTPVGLGHTPLGAIRIGQAMAVAWVMIPVFGAAWAGARDAAIGRSAAALLGFAIALAAAAVMKPMQDAAFAVHVDAPAVGLGVLACLAAARWESTGRLVLAGSLAAAAVFCKQTMVGLAVGLVVWVLVVGGWRRAAVTAVAGLAAGSVLAGACAVAFDAKALWHVTVTLPSRHEFPGGFAASFVRVSKESAWMLPPLVPVVVLLAWPAIARRGRSAIAEVGTLLLVAAAAEWPLAMLGYMKFGGGPNNLAYCEMFLVAFVAWAVAKLVAEHASAVALAAVLVLAAGVCVWRLASADSSVIGQPSKHELSYRLVRASPGRYFFPRLPLAHLMGEGRLTHHHWGLYDYVLAGEPVSDAWFWRYIPPDAVVVAHNDRPPGTKNLMHQRLAPRYPKQARLPELPGWYCFLRADGG